MSERGHFRGGERGGGRGGGGRGGPRGASRGGAHGNQLQPEKPKKENILDLSKYMDKEVCVKFSGGRESKSRSIAVKMHHNIDDELSNRNAQGLRPAYESGPR